MPRVLSEKCIQEIDRLCGHYPTRMAAMLPALHAAQDEVGHISSDVMHDIADALDVHPTRVHEAVTFYTMFYNRPVGRHVVKICRNLACELRGANQIIENAKQLLGIELGETTADGRITLEVEECLASCGTGPMLWCRSRKGPADTEERIVENLTAAKLETFLGDLP
ncbi:MAG: NAD(P)H-dependent oxidoreductase subunit E [Myxococcota bacterium]